jgi:hypothetical protein
MVSTGWLSAYVDVANRSVMKRYAPSDTPEKIEAVLQEMTELSAGGI